jgi:SNF2 family DNA or RNA helicase
VKFTPRPYQSRALRHVLDHPCCALFLDCGLGKTAVVLEAVARLIDRAEVRAALVVAPLRVCELVWPAEVAKWDSTAGMVVSAVHGKGPNQRRAALTPGADLYVINYENIPWLADWMTEHPKAIPFDALVWDESSKMKSHAARRFKRMKPLLFRFHRNIILTGTPMPKAYMDLWSQFYLLDRGLRLEPFFTRFRSDYFNQTDYMGYTYELRPGSKERIEAKIADITLALSADDHLRMPALIVNRVLVPLPGSLREKYETLERDLFVEIESLEVEAVNAAALLGKALQLTSGAMYRAQAFDTDGKPLRREWEPVHTAKVDALREIVEESQGQPILALYWYKPELAILRKAFPKAPTLDGSAEAVAKLEAEWNAGRIPLMFAHPMSTGHGLNLQHGGHILVFLTLPPFNAELYQQTVARLRRQGQAHPVVVHHLICPGTVDEASEASIATKGDRQRGLMAALRDYAAKARKSEIAETANGGKA